MYRFDLPFEAAPEVLRCSGQSLVPAYCNISFPSAALSFSGLCAPTRSQFSLSTLRYRV